MILRLITTFQECDGEFSLLSITLSSSFDRSDSPSGHDDPSGECARQNPRSLSRLKGAAQFAHPSNLISFLALISDASMLVESNGRN